MCMCICKYCGNERKNSNSLRNHERLCKLNPERSTTLFQNEDFQKNRNKSNQYIKALETGTVYSLPEESRKKLSDSAKTRVVTQKRRDKMREYAISRNLGGHTSKQKLYFEKKTGEVIYLQSSYEINFAKLLEELNIEWSRSEPFIWIDSKGLNHRYYPDFKINNIYIDTKNDYLAVKDLPKINAVKEQNQVDIIIVTKDFITKEYIQSLL